MKRILILVLSCETPPYDKMVQTSKETWDSVNVDGVDTLYYFGESNKQNTPTEIYLPVKESLSRMGEKTLQALEWVNKYKQYDYIARVNSSCYVSKKKLFDYVQSLPDTGVFEGLVCDSQNGFKYVWGGGQYIISKDVVKQMAENRNAWDHRYMEDESMSALVNRLGIPYKNGNACSINEAGGTDSWLLFSYGFGDNVSFKDFKDIKDSPHYFYRVKQDGKRHLDEYIMRELHVNNT